MYCIVVKYKLQLYDDMYRYVAEKLELFFSLLARGEAYYSQGPLLQTYIIFSMDE